MENTTANHPFWRQGTFTSSSSITTAIFPGLHRSRTASSPGANRPTTLIEFQSNHSRLVPHS